jgi:3-methyladenine DNA glycosylase/8-oxoguanine DNA glycosylase
VEVQPDRTPSQRKLKTEVEERTRAAFEEGDSNTAVEELMELTGVRVPVASGILTMFDPEAYAVIDFRVIRALGKVKPDLLGSGSYEAYAEFMEHFRSYGTRPQTYEFYMEHVDELCSDTSLTPREVDMALWTLDKRGGTTE